MGDVPRIVVICGLPCSGKSTVVARVRAELRLPVFCKDEYKERLFDTLGHSDRDWSRRVSQAAYALMFAHTDELLRAGLDCAIEGNFRWAEHCERFACLASSAVLQIHCRANGPVLAARFRERVVLNARHPGHVDAASHAEIEQELLSTDQTALPLAGQVIECDTTGDWRTAVANAVSSLRDALRR